MDDIASKRVFADRAGAAELLVAGASGVVAVEVSGGRVGRFGVVHREPSVAVAAGEGAAALAAAGDVHLRRDGGTFEPTGFGPAVAVAIADGALTAAGPDGRLAHLPLDDAGADWAALGTVGAAVRAIDPPLLATADGLRRLPELDYVGLDDAHDVAAAGPLAATAGGLFTLGNGWMRALPGEFRRCATDGVRAHAATVEQCFERRDGDWVPLDLPADGLVVGVAYGEAVYVVTEDGTVLAEGEDGWRRTSLGVAGVVGCALG